jgi:hypothetical protein
MRLGFVGIGDADVADGFRFGGGCSSGLDRFRRAGARLGRPGSAGPCPPALGRAVRAVRGRIRGRDGDHLAVHERDARGTGPEGPCGNGPSADGSPQSRLTGRPTSSTSPRST